MASEKQFSGIPPFPDNVPEISLSTIPLASLRRSGNGKGHGDLLAACQGLGFFLLDLRGDEFGETIMAEIDQLFDAGKDIMNLPPHVKQSYLHDMPKNSLG